MVAGAYLKYRTPNGYWAWSWLSGTWQPAAHSPPGWLQCFAPLLPSWFPGWLLLCRHIQNIISINYQGGCFRCFLWFTCFFPSLSFPFFLPGISFKALDIPGTEQYLLMHLLFFDAHYKFCACFPSEGRVES